MLWTTCLRLQKGHRSSFHADSCFCWLCSIFKSLSDVLLMIFWVESHARGKAFSWSMVVSKPKAGTWFLAKRTFWRVLFLCEYNWNVQIWEQKKGVFESHRSGSDPKTGTSDLLVCCLCCLSGKVRVLQWQSRAGVPLVPCKITAWFFFSNESFAGYKQVATLIVVSTNRQSISPVWLHVGSELSVFWDGARFQKSLLFLATQWWQLQLQLLLPSSSAPDLQLDGRSQADRTQKRLKISEGKRNPLQATGLLRLSRTKSIWVCSVCSVFNHPTGPTIDKCMCLACMLKQFAWTHFTQWHCCEVTLQSKQLSHGHNWSQPLRGKNHRHQVQIHLFSEMRKTLLRSSSTAFRGLGAKTWQAWTPTLKISTCKTGDVKIVPAAQNWDRAKML